MKFEFEYDDLVIGNDLNAVHFAFKNGYPIVFKDLIKPFTKDITKHEENKKRLMEKYIQLLSISGLVPFSNLVGNIRIEEDNVVSVSGKRPWIAKLKCKNIHNFLVEEYSSEQLFKVIDYIRIDSCSPHSLTKIENKEDNFVNEIVFYPSPRDPFYKNVKLESKQYFEAPKDAMLISFLTKKEIESDDFSSNYARLKMQILMKDNGLVGRKSGTIKNKDGITIQIVRAIKSEFLKREIVPVDSEDEYDKKTTHEYMRKIIGFLWTNNKQVNRVREIFI